MDVCIYSGAPWNGTPNGLSTWIDMLLLACSDIQFVVCCGTTEQPRAGRLPTNVRGVATFGPGEVPPLPRAERYVLSGPVAATILAAHPQIASRAVYVEHGDAVREALLGDVDEGGRPFRGSNAAQRISRQRRDVVQRCALTVGVTDRTKRRLSREGLDARTISNAVPACYSFATKTRSPGFVGRLCRTKGSDRLNRLASRIETKIRVVGPVTGAGQTPADREGSLERPWNVLPAINLLPSRSEACPFSVLEAEARGIMSLCTLQTQLKSPLILRLPWHEATWAKHIEKYVERPLRPELGAQLARRRWSGFKHAWNATLAGAW